MMNFPFPIILNNNLFPARARWPLGDRCVLGPRLSSSPPLPKSRPGAHCQPADVHG